MSLRDIKTMHFSEKEVERFRLRQGDILLGEASGSRREVGKPAIWREEIPLCCFQNTLLRVRPYSTEMADYLYWHFYRDAFNGLFAAASKGIGIYHLGAENMENWMVCVPPVPEQMEIVRRISTAWISAETIGAAITQGIGRVKDLNSATLAKAFRGELVAQDPTDEPASVLLERIQFERVQQSTKTEPRSV